MICIPPSGALFGSEKGDEVLSQIFDRGAKQKQNNSNEKSLRRDCTLLGDKLRCNSNLKWGEDWRVVTGHDVSGASCKSERVKVRSVRSRINFQCQVIHKYILWIIPVRKSRNVVNTDFFGTICVSLKPNWIAESTRDEIFEYMICVIASGKIFILFLSYDPHWAKFASEWDDFQIAKLSLQRTLGSKTFHLQADQYAR